MPAHSGRTRRPFMDRGARLWLSKTARKNYWRVAAWLDLADLLQDGMDCWQRVGVRYPQVNRRHRMALFQRTYTNHLHQLANRRSAVAVEQSFAELPDTAPCDYSELLRLLAEAPSGLRDCLKAIVADPALLHRPHRRYLNGQRQDTNSWLCEIVGLDPEKHDLYRQLNELLGRDPTAE